jgi:hypothetical protein
MSAPRNAAAQSSRTRRPYSTNVYATRQRVKRAGFAELRFAFVRHGTLTDKFLRLDEEIEDFSGQWMPFPTTQPMGVSAKIEDQLDRIEEQAKMLPLEG